MSDSVILCPVRCCGAAYRNAFRLVKCDTDLTDPQSLAIVIVLNPSHPFGALHP